MGGGVTSVLKMLSVVTFEGVWQLFSLILFQPRAVHPQCYPLDTYLCIVRLLGVRIDPTVNSENYSPSALQFITSTYKMPLTS